MTNKLLDISELSKLRITTVKLWCVNFTYDNELYFLHDDSDEDRGIGLYHRKNNLIPELIVGKITLRRPNDFIRLSYGKEQYSKHNKRNIVFSQIDKDYFVKKLTYEGLITSCFDKECSELHENIKHIRDEIESHQDIITSLRDKITKLENFKEGE